jgi:gamma-butyrobetaine dioxygenase
MSSPPDLKKIEWTSHTVTLDWSNGARSEFSSLWLLDNCSIHRHSENGQRLIDIVDLPEAPKIRSVSSDRHSILVQWEDEPAPAAFDLAWLLDNASGTPPPDSKLYSKTWLEGSNMDAAKDFAWHRLSEFSSDLSVRREWMTRLVQDGIAFLSDVPCIRDSVLEVVPWMGIVSETNYGRVFNVQFLPHPENLADSDRGLGLHTDNPYRDPVPGFQTLHFLVTAPEGGENLFADGFAIAEHLRAAQPGLFETLARTPVAFAFRSKDADFRCERSLIQVSHRGQLQAVHYNSRSMAPLRLNSSEIDAFYAAYRRFAALLHDQRFQLKIKMKNGDLVAFDNQRILHGRTRFSASQHARHLQGCYLTRDSVLSQMALLRRQSMPQTQVA